MNREEALQKLQNFYDWYNDDELDFDKEKEIKYDNDLKNIIEYLRQPTTLAEFLGWEENEIYIYFQSKYMVKNDELCFLNCENEWKNASCYRALIEIKQRTKKFECKKFECKKIEPKKYYLQLKFKYNDFLCKRENETYINFNTENEYFLDLKDDIDDCQTQFTDEEIQNIKLPEPLTIDMFEKIEVE